ncbi:Flavobacterial-specific protein antigen [Flavobacterium psychrophilum]|uniref:outer membrane beta-barrel protein n=1 Tax=Flavobacterium psychrophilum TaxID=96345 RepID=UPI000B7C3CC0|nr:outer membrane beta-barrel protein [Flavobacterium psychrophilum]QRE60890.1 outer membrane beta-barrel protein [Flavobacterium psychrophilum]QRE63077.1 outer membrane beta-barrel protein [Flavobacterium psychrophilum]SNB43108.1 Flavobacterial-specific protein antigen [Flavobacterium psychrophilum]
MKKVLLTAIAVFTFGFANAQKSSILVAGTVGFNSTSQGDTKSSGFDFSPKVGYQFSENMTVGIEGSFRNNTETSTTGSISFGPITLPGISQETVYTNTKIGAFFRYAQPLAGVFSAFADLGVGMQSRKTSVNTPGSTDLKSNGFYIGVTPAIGVDMKKGFCLNFAIGGLGYNTMKADADGAKAANNFELNFGKQVSVGISKNF